ncbi:hypothetical protein F4804DRAFT_296148 [Jackrogersella minutella]|nr:hypothetical protein F4804DRAFT_296148 [Jackrogersella minutella]
MISQLASIFAVLALLASVSDSFTYKGCFNAAGSLQFNSRYIFQSVGYCQRRCALSNMPVMGLTNRSDCMCGPSALPLDNVVEESFCNFACPGYAPQTCGGDGFFSVYQIAEPDTSEAPQHEASTQYAEPAETVGVSSQATVGSSPLLLGNSEL